MAAQQKIKVGRSVTIWAFVLFGLTGLAVASFWASGFNPDTGFSPLIILIAYSPSLAALLVGWLLPGAGGVREIFRQLAKWRVHVLWYAIALLGPLVLVLTAEAIFALMGGSLPNQWLAIPDSAALSAAVGPLIAGSLGEEIGWRGFGQRLLQKRYTVLTAALTIGVLWATWHSWPILAPGGGDHLSALDVLQTYVRLIATAVIYAWIYASTGSLLLVLLAHAGHNIAIDLLAMPTTGSDPLSLLIALLYAVAAVVIVFGARKKLKLTDSAWVALRGELQPPFGAAEG